MRITCAPVCTQEEGNKGDVDDVAHMMRLAERSAALTSSLSADGEDAASGAGLAMNWKETLGKRGSRNALSASALELRLRLTIVHEVIDGKNCRWRSRCDSICFPAPNATTDVGLRSPTIFVERREPSIQDVQPRGYA